MRRSNEFLIDSATRKRLRQLFYRCLMEEHEDGGVFTDKLIGTRTLLTMSNKNGATRVCQEQVIFNGKVLTSSFFISLH